MKLGDIIEIDNKKYKNMTPTMTSNTTPSPYIISSSSIYSSEYDAYRAFDDSTIFDTENGWAIKIAADTTPWIKIDLNSKTTLSLLQIYTRNRDNDNFPRDFQLLGSNDDIDYVLIQSFTKTDWNIGKNNFYLDKKANYRYYKIQVNSFLNNIGWMAIGQIFLLSSDLYGNNYLIKDNDKYKTIQENNLIEVANFLEELNKENSDVCIHDLNDIIPFIPSFSEGWKIVSNKNFNLKVDALKLNQEMITTLEPLNMRAYDVIHNITGDYVIKNNGVIKFIFSFDKGSTWKTYDVTNSEWNDVNVDIPIKLYENFTDEDKTNWNDATNTILSDGISVQNLDNVDFQSVKTDKLMFAVAFSRPTYADTCTLKGLNINYDGLETYIQLACGSDLSKYEATISITGDSVEVKTASNQNKILVTMTTNI